MSSKSKPKRMAQPRSAKKQRQASRPLIRRQNAPAAKGAQIMHPKASIRPVGGSEAAILVRHSEYLGDLISPGSGTYNLLKTIAINPGNVDFCPWMTAIAMNYETYTIKKCTIRFESLLPTSSGGVILMMVDFDSYDLSPPNKTSFLNNHKAMRSNVWQQGLLHLDPADLQKIKKRFCLDVPPPDGRDVRLYNVGNLFIAASGGPVGITTLGELYVDYEIELQTPQVNNLTETVDIVLAGDTAPGTPWKSVAGVAAAVTGAAALVKTVVDQPSWLSFNKVGKFLVEQFWQTDAAHGPVDAAATVTPVDGRSQVTSPYGQATYSHAASSTGFMNQTTKVVEVLQAPANVIFDATPVGTAGFNLTGGGNTTSRTHISEL